MEKGDAAFCGLNCAVCKMRSKKIREKALELQEAMDEMNVKEMSKVIPFMHGKYKAHNKLMKFFTESECPGCREEGGNPFCGIRKCARKKGYTTCAECETLCKRFNMLYRVHTDNEIQKNIAVIQKDGIEGLVRDYNKTE